jgi:hypothetical protein
LGYDRQRESGEILHYGGTEDTEDFDQVLLRSELHSGGLVTETGKSLRVFATADIGDAGFARLRKRGYEVEVYPNPEPPPKNLIVEKVRSGIDALITTSFSPKLMPRF